jgi:hypothetical protein
MITNHPGRVNVSSRRYNIEGNSLLNINERAEKLRSRKLFVTPKQVEEPRSEPKPPALPVEREENPPAGTFISQQGDITRMWMFSRATATRRGVRIGNIDRSLSTVEGEINWPRLWNDHVYRKEIFALIGLSNYEGMSVGKNLVLSGTSDKLAEIWTNRALNHHVRGANFVRRREFNEGMVWTAGRGSVDQDADNNVPVEDSNPSERLREAIKAEAADSMQYFAETAVANRELPNFEIFAEAALDENPDVSAKEVEAAYEVLERAIKRGNSDVDITDLFDEPEEDEERGVEDLEELDVEDEGEE